MPADSGRDEETLDEAKKRAPHAIRSRYRAVTAEDFELLAMEASSIKRAKALPLYHPDFPGVKVPGVVTIIVVPDGDGPSPTPSEGTLRSVCAYLDQRRLLTTELYVDQADLPAGAKSAPRSSPTTTRILRSPATTRAVAARLLSSIEGRRRRTGLALRRDDLLLTRQPALFHDPGRASVTSLVIVLDGEEIPACTDVTINEAGLLFATEHQIDVSYRFES